MAVNTASLLNVAIISSLGHPKSLAGTPGLSNRSKLTLVGDAISALRSPVNVCDISTVIFAWLKSISIGTSNKLSTSPTSSASISTGVSLTYSTHPSLAVLKAFVSLYLPVEQIDRALTLQ